MRNLLITVVVGLCVAVLHRLIYLLIATPIQWWMGHEKSFDLILVFYNLPLGFMSYCVIFVAADYIFSQRDEARASREQAEVSQLKAELKDAQLRALRMQLQPHFILTCPRRAAPGYQITPLRRFDRLFRHPLAFAVAVPARGWPKAYYRHPNSSRCTLPNATP